MVETQLAEVSARLQALEGTTSKLGLLDDIVLLLRGLQPGASLVLQREAATLQEQDAGAGEDGKQRSRPLLGILPPERKQQLVPRISQAEFDARSQEYSNLSLEKMNKLADLLSAAADADSSPRPRTPRARTASSGSAASPRAARGAASSATSTGSGSIGADQVVMSEAELAAAVKQVIGWRIGSVSSNMYVRALLHFKRAKWDENDAPGSPRALVLG